MLGETKQAMVRGPKKEQMPSQQTVHQGLEPLGAEGTRPCMSLTQFQCWLTKYSVNFIFC